MISNLEYKQLELFSQLPEKETSYSAVKVPDLDSLKYIPDFSAESKHPSLLKQKDREPWLSDLKKRVQDYGSKCSYKARGITTSVTSKQKFQQLELNLFSQLPEKTATYSVVEVAEIGGLKYIADFITQSEHDFLLKQIDGAPWLSDLKRRVQHYGYKYNYKARAIDSSMQIGSLPDWALEVAYKLHKENFINELPDQVIVNEYQPGQGISSHIDCVPCFTDTIISLSLGSNCVMDFKSLATGKKIPILLEPRSLTVLKDDARYKWTHSIAARRIDQFHKQVITRERRVSLTFRKVILVGK